MLAWLKFGEMARNGYFLLNGEFKFGELSLGKVITHAAHVNMVSTYAHLAPILYSSTALKLSDGYLRSGKLCPWPSRCCKYMEPHDRRAAIL